MAECVDVLRIELLLSGTGKIMKALRDLVRLMAIWARHYFLRKVYGMDIATSARISWGAKLDKTNPRGVHIGAESYIASGAIVFSHDFSRALKADTKIGERCFVGANAVIMAGVEIGDEVIVGVGAIVTKSVPSGSIVAGNPARTIRTGVRTKRFGQILDNGVRLRA